MSRSNSPRPDWSQPLARRIRTRSGVELATLHDAAKFLTDRIPEPHQLRPSWQFAAELLMRAAQTRRAADRKEATDQVARALFGAGLQSKSPP